MDSSSSSNHSMQREKVIDRQFMARLSIIIFRLRDMRVIMDNLNRVTRLCCMGSNHKDRLVTMGNPNRLCMILHHMDNSQVLMANPRSSPVITVRVSMILRSTANKRSKLVTQAVLMTFLRSRRITMDNHSRATLLCIQISKVRPTRAHTANRSSKISVLILKWLIMQAIFTV